jgi:hypothetical protein
MFFARGRTFHGQDLANFFARRSLLESIREDPVGTRNRAQKRT